MGVVGTKTYACTLKGVAIQAVDEWEYAQSVLGTRRIDDNERTLLSGRCQAYETILATITGVRATCTEDVVARWRESIQAMV